MDNLWEDEIKNSILQNKVIFNQLGNLGQTLIIYEKKIYKRVIADALIFSQNQGIIGVEIKTQHDTLKRLPRQLDSYVRTCQYTYVYCHDSKVNKVQDLLAKKGYDCVGIISYEEFDGQALPGLVKSPTKSPYLIPWGYTSVLWNSELQKIIELATHEKPYSRKRDMINSMANIFPKEGAERVIANLYIDGNTDIEKQLQRYDFGMQYDHDVTFKGGWHHA